jgi:hypothetical protein
MKRGLWLTFDFRRAKTVPIEAIAREMISREEVSGRDERGDTAERSLCFPELHIA